MNVHSQERGGEGRGGAGWGEGEGLLMKSLDFGGDMPPRSSDH